MKRLQALLESLSIDEAAIQWHIAGYGRAQSTGANYQYFYSDKEDKYLLYRFLGQGRKTLLGKFVDVEKAKQAAEADWKKNPAKSAGGGIAKP